VSLTRGRPRPEVRQVVVGDGHQRADAVQVEARERLGRARLPEPADDDVIGVRAGEAAERAVQPGGEQQVGDDASSTAVVAISTMS